MDGQVIQDERLLTTEFLCKKNMKHIYHPCYQTTHQQCNRDRIKTDTVEPTYNTITTLNLFVISAVCNYFYMQFLVHSVQEMHVAGALKQQWTPFA